MLARNLIAAVSLLVAGTAANAGTITIDSSNWGACLGLTACVVDGASLSASGAFDSKSNNGATGLGVAGRTNGEIDIAEQVYVDFGGLYFVDSIQVLFLYNGPEYNDRAEIAQITVGNVAYTLSPGGLQDDTGATWSGPGSVSKCGATINQAGGTGCFLISNPFASPVQFLSFTALHGNAPYAGPGTNDSDYSLGSIQASRSVPEPGPLALLGMGALALALGRRRGLVPAN